MTGIRRQLHGKLVHSHLHSQHNVINCTCDKSSISPSLLPAHHWSQPLFFEDFICNLIPLLLHPPQLTLKAIPFAGNVRNWFPSNQDKNILPVRRRLSISLPPSSTSNSSNPPSKADRGLILSFNGFRYVIYKICNHTHPTTITSY